MFQRKSKPEQVRDSAIDAKDKAVSSVGTVAGSVLHAVRDAFDEKVAPKVGAAAETASSKTADVRHSARERGSDFAHQAKDKATHARDRAVSGIDHGIDSAVPRGQEAVAAVGPRVDHARDVLVDDLLPRISELLGNFQDAKNEVLSNKSAPLATLTGTPKKKSRKGGALILFGVAAAVGAAVAYYLNSQKKPATDPWATDHHVGGAPGVDAQVRATLADKKTATTSTSTTGAGTGTGTKSTSTSTTGAGTAGAATAGTAGTAGTASTSTPAAPKASDTPIADSLSSKASTSGDKVGDKVDGDLDGGAASTRMLSGDEIDQLAADVPDDEIPGTSGSATSGFGTDFGDVDSVKDATKDATKRETDLP